MSIVQVVWLVEVSMLIAVESVLYWSLVVGSTSSVGIVVIVVAIMVAVKWD